MWVDFHPLFTSLSNWQVVRQPEIAKENLNNIKILGSCKISQEMPAMSRKYSGRID